MDAETVVGPTWNSKEFSFDKRSLDLVNRLITEGEPRLKSFVTDLYKISLLHPGIWTALNRKGKDQIRHSTLLEVS